MKYRIGIFDPAFRTEGHFIAFNRYLANLFQSSDIEIVFIDADGSVEKAYRTSMPVSYLRLSPANPTSNLGRVRRLLSRYAYWKKAFRDVSNSNIDLLLFSADPRDLLMCVAPIKVPYAAIILYPYGYVDEKKKSIQSKIAAHIYKKFITNAVMRITTNEPPLLKNIEKLLSVNDIHLIPDVPAVAQKTPANTVKDIDFLTIGTISKSKNHLFAVTTLLEANLPYHYFIAGKPLDSIGEEVKNKVAMSKFLGGYFEYLDDSTYFSYMHRSKFILFPYDFTRGNISSQVLHDAFSVGIPVIAPNIEPFKWYMEKYFIGFMYKEGDKNSFLETLQKSMETDSSIFIQGFTRIQQEHSLESIRSRFLPEFLKVLRRVIQK